MFREAPPGVRIESREHSPSLTWTPFSLTSPALVKKKPGQGGGEEGTRDADTHLVLGDPSAHRGPRPRLCLLLELGGPQPGCRARLKVTGKFSRNPLERAGVHTCTYGNPDYLHKKEKHKNSSCVFSGKRSHDMTESGEETRSQPGSECRQRALLQPPGLQPARVLPLRLDICIQAPRTAAGAHGFLLAVPVPGMCTPENKRPGFHSTCGRPVAFRFRCRHYLAQTKVTVRPRCRGSHPRMKDRDRVAASQNTESRRITGNTGFADRQRGQGSCRWWCRGLDRERKSEPPERKPEPGPLGRKAQIRHQLPKHRGQGPPEVVKCPPCVRGWDDGQMSAELLAKGLGWPRLGPLSPRGPQSHLRPPELPGNTGVKLETFPGQPLQGTQCGGSTWVLAHREVNRGRRRRDAGAEGVLCRRQRHRDPERPGAGQKQGPPSVRQRRGLGRADKALLRLGCADVRPQGAAFHGRRLGLHT